ncbi:hypothetical protein [Streptomyces cyslabdanicus]|uniref:hypothetical protein n=1 Tax=Streptomyces cyslabdanicus TaxID=1470456 RepID=UPI0040450892
MRGTALAALRGWAARRDRLAANRANLMAAAWWAGTRTIAELARAADVSRDTVYDELRRPRRRTHRQDRRTRRHSPALRAPHNRARAELAQHAWSLVRPAMLTDRPDWLATAPGA